MSLCVTLVSLLENSCLMTGTRSSHGKASEQLPLILTKQSGQQR